LEGKERLGSFKRKLYHRIGFINKSYCPYMVNFNVPKFPRMLGAYLSHSIAPHPPSTNILKIE
jgi:hypothetical protein